MPYPALPDHRISYDNDGSLLYWGNMTTGAANLISQGNMLELQDNDYADVALGGMSTTTFRVFMFFPEQREITGYHAIVKNDGVGVAGTYGFSVIEGSNDTSNGLDGTWETASLPGGATSFVNNFSWRSNIKAVSFTGPKKSLRTGYSVDITNDAVYLQMIHFYGEAAGGQMAHDLIFLDPDLGAGVAYPAAEDFGDQPLGTSVVRPWILKNTSATRTATNVNIQCNDPDFTIATAAGGPWVATINIASLGPGVESATMYVRCTTPAPGAALKPRFARIIAVCDAGFFG